ncbi:protein Wnt-8b-like [Amphibalanus amphitrite]|uniref:protein Wnt-8b-like n=1 Tax=Amphibalanus amphitrite TaxID=1232801 RepID=UPI001C91E4EA|nr:protein Wnt-8b-like [Amphibalanus amphitrite]
MGVLIRSWLWCCAFAWSFYSSSALAWSLGNVLMTGISAGVEFTDNMAVGQRLAHTHCQKQFFWHQWNCPTEEFLKRNHQPGPATREAAVVDALTAGAIAYSLTRNCSSGQIAGCTCQSRPTRRADDWQWGGCSDNVEFGVRMSQQFLDHVPLNMPLHRALLRLHNNQAGRELVRRSTRRLCKCHGVSGSCSMETCWTQIADFTITAERVRRRYRKAKRLTLGSDGNDVSPTASVSFEGVRVTDLTYMDDSPDFCRTVAPNGDIGTRGRECSRATGPGVTHAERRSCKNLCRRCGRRVKRQVTEVKTSCNCKFHWCCQVTCDTCTQKSYKYTCR